MVSSKIHRCYINCQPQRIQLEQKAFRGRVKLILFKVLLYAKYIQALCLLYIYISISICMSMSISLYLYNIYLYYLYLSIYMFCFLAISSWKVSQHPVIPSLPETSFNLKIRKHSMRQR